MAIQAMRWFMLVMPIIVLYFKEHGLSMTEVFLLQSIYSVAVLILEIPSGYFADKFGKKKSIVLGSALGVVGYCAYAFIQNFYGFIFAELALGFGASLISGADVALLYESLKAHKNEILFNKALGRMHAVENMSEAISSLLGGFIAASSLVLPFYFQIAMMLGATILSFTLTEVKADQTLEENIPIESFQNAIKMHLFQNKKILWIIIFSGFLGASTLSMTWFSQPYMNMVGLDIKLFGIVWTLISLIVAFSSHISYRLSKSLSLKNMLLLVSILPIIGFFLLSQTNSIWGLSFLGLFAVTRGVSHPLLKTLINEIIPSKFRATVMSVQNFSLRSIFAVCAPFIGWLSDSYSLLFALFSSGAIFGVCIIFSLYGLRKSLVK